MNQSIRAMHMDIFPADHAHSGMRARRHQRIAPGALESHLKRGSRRQEVTIGAKSQEKS